ERHELLARERHWRETIKATLNIVCPFRTEEETKAAHTESNRKYNEEHKEQNTLYFQKYYQDHKVENSEKCRAYYQQHKEEIRMRVKEYQSQKYTCECGKTLTRSGKRAHEKSKFHQQWAVSRQVELEPATRADGTIGRE